MKPKAMSTPTLLAYINSLELMSTNYYNLSQEKIKPALIAGDISRTYAEDASAKCEKAFKDIQKAIEELENELGKRIANQFGFSHTPKSFGKMVDGFYSELEKNEIAKKEREIQQKQVAEKVGKLDLDLPASDKVIPIGDSSQK